MNFDNKIFPFFTEEEVKQNGLILMLLAQNALLERTNAIVKDGDKLTNEQFFAVLQSSPNLQDILRDAVSVPIKLIDWDRCHDIAVSNSLKREKEEENKRRENIKLL